MAGTHPAIPHAGWVSVCLPGRQSHVSADKNGSGTLLERRFVHTSISIVGLRIGIGVAWMSSADLALRL